MERKASLADEIEVWGFEDDNIIFDDGSLGFGFRLKTIDISCFSDESINSIKARSSQFLNGLPTGIDLQFIADIQSGNEATLNEHLLMGVNSTNEFAHELSKARVEKFRSYDQRGILPKYNLYLFVRRPLTQALIQKPKIFSRNGKFQEIAEDRLLREIISLNQLKEILKQGLFSAGLESSELSSKDIMDLLFEQWNPGAVDKPKSYDPSDIRQNLLLTDLGLLDRGFLIGDTHHRLVSLKILPDLTHAGMAKVLGGLPFSSRLFLSIHVPDQTKEIESLKTQRRIAFSMARGKKTGVSDIESESKLQDLETLLEQMIAQGEKVFRVSANVLLKSKDPDELEDKVSSTISTIRSLSGSEAMEETLATYFVFKELALPNARGKERAKRVKTSNLSDLLPIYGPYEGMKRPAVLLRTDAGSLFKFDPFDSDLTNANQLISGGSGAGKSFLTNILIMQMLKENPRVFFVDIGGSYKKICENLSGEYLPLGIGLGVSINPFDLLPGETVPSPQKIKFLLGLVELMTKEDDLERIPKLERSEIEEAIQKVYETRAKPRLTDLREILLSHPDTQIKRFGRILASWCGETPYGKFVDRETNISITNPLVAFDLKGMESYPDLQSVCLFMITDLVWREVQKDRETLKFLVFDECWKLLKNEAGLVFIEEVFRTFRKYRASAIAISQDIDDFAKSKIANAILPNCSIKWILMQPQADGNKLKEALNLNPNEIAIIKNLYQEKGRFSQAFLIAQNNKTMTVIESTPLEYWIATTDPKDLAEVDRIAKEKPDLSHVKRLKMLADSFPLGVAAKEREK